jgi:hypothetical protein
MVYNDADFEGQENMAVVVLNSTVLEEHAHGPEEVEFSGKNILLSAQKSIFRGRNV